MVPYIYSDSAYFTMPEAIIYYKGHFNLSDWPSPRPIKPNPERNAPIYTKCKKIQNVLSSEAKPETCGTLNNGKTAIDMRPALILLYHKQPATPLKMDNYTTEAFVIFEIKPNFSKTWYMKWHWLRYKEVLEQMRVYWDKGTNNDANYLQNITPQFTIVKYVLNIYIPQT